MDDIKLRQEDHSFWCTSVQNIVNDRKQDSNYGFGEKKRKKKDHKTREKTVVDTDNESIIYKHETEEEEHRKKHGSENQCGNIIDIEA